MTTYFISDTHFDHANIIKYCDRPFSSVEAMNRVMLDNWRSTVRPEDTVYFLGDLAFGRGSRPARWWLAQLTGHIIFVKGSHDHGIRPTSTGLPNVDRVVHGDVIDAGALGLVALVHDPVAAYPWGKAWAFHGHIHNNEGSCRVDASRKLFNVCVEVNDYRPVKLETIVSLCCPPVGPATKTGCCDGRLPVDFV